MESKCERLRCVVQSVSLVISLSSLMVNAACSGPLLPTSCTCLTLLPARAATAWEHMSVVCVCECKKSSMCVSVCVRNKIER